MRVLVVLAVLALLCKHVDSFHQPRLWFGNMKHRQSSRRLCAMVNSGGFVDDIKQGGLARTLLGLAVGTGLALQPLAANADIDTTSSTPVVAEIAVAESNSVGDSITAKAALPTEGLLKATLRGERSASPAPVKKANILKALQSSSLPSISIDTNAVNVDNLRSALRALPKQWPYLAAVGVAVFVADSVQYNKQLKENVDEQLDQIESLRKKLAASESEGISKEEDLQMMQLRASALQQELAALTSQLDLSSKEIQTLKKAIEKLSNNEQLIRDLEAEAGRLRGEVRALEQIRDNPSSLPVVKALKEQIAMMIERDQLLIQKLKEFLTTNEFLPEGIANMLLVATAPQMLDEILSKGQQQKQVESVTLPTATLRHPEDEAKIHEQSKQINALQSDVDKLKASAAKLEDTLAAYSQDFSQWIEKQSPELLAWMKAKDISSHKFSTNVLQEVVQFYHEKVQESHATNAQKVAQEGTEEAKKLQQQLASREQEMQTMQSTLKQSESTLHSNAERISVLEASQQSLEAQLKQEQHKSKTLSVELEEASKQPPAVAAAAAAAAAVPSVTTSSTSAKKSSKSTASSTSEDDSSEKVKKLESNLESAKVMAKELRNRLGEKELEYNQMVAEYVTKIRELEEAKAKSDGHAAKQTMLLEEELRAARYEAKLKYTKDPSAKRQPGRRKKVLEEEGEVSTEDGEPELTPREMLEIQELEEAARAEAAKARREAEDKKMFEALKQAWTEISKMDANEVTKEEMKEFAIKYKLPFSKQEMKSMRKMELFDRSFQYIRTYGKPAADR